MSVISDIGSHVLLKRDAPMPRMGKPPVAPGEPLDRMDARAPFVVALAAVMWALFLVLWFVAPNVAVLRSDQIRGVPSAEMPGETGQVFRSIVGFERCAAGNGVHQAFQGRWARDVLAGSSFVTYTHWRDECGGMSVVFDARDASTETRARMMGLIDALRASGERLGRASVAGVATDAMFDRAARDFHAAARDAGLGYRLVSWVRQ